MVGRDAVVGPLSGVVIDVSGQIRSEPLLQRVLAFDCLGVGLTRSNQVHVWLDFLVRGEMLHKGLLFAIRCFNDEVTEEAEHVLFGVRHVKRAVNHLLLGG